MALPEARFGGLSSFLSTTPCLSSQRSYSLCGYGLATTTAKWKLAQGCQRVGHAVESRDTRAGQMISCAMKRNNLLRCVGGAMRASSSTGAMLQIADAAWRLHCTQAAEVDTGFDGNKLLNVLKSGRNPQASEWWSGIHRKFREMKEPHSHTCELPRQL